MRLPILQDIQTQQTVVSAFGGLNHTPSVQENQFFDMQNMTSDQFPLLAPRQPYARVKDLPFAQGLYAHNALCWAAAGGFYYDGVKKGTVSPGEKQIVGMGSYITVWPDKKMYKTETGEWMDLEARDEEAYIPHKDDSGNWYESLLQYVWNGKAEIPCLNIKAKHGLFRQGDGIFVHYIARISTDPGDPDGWYKEDRSFSTIVSIFQEGESGGLDDLYIPYDERFADIYRDAADFGSEYLTIERPVPDMDFVCESGNRLWGCSSAKHEIYASALGDPFNWNVFEHTSQDSYVLPVGSTGDFTGVCAYGGGVLFFKEDGIHRIYGTRPTNYQLTVTACPGVQAGCHKALCTLNETVFYKSPKGVCAYSGGLPAVISAELGDVSYSRAVGGEFQGKYYLSMLAAPHACYPDDMRQAHWELLVYDTEKGLWHKEAPLEVSFFAKFNNRLYFVDEQDRGLYITRPDSKHPAAGRGPWNVQTGKLLSGLPGNKTVSRLQLKVSLFSQSRLCIQLRYDTAEEWQTVYQAVSRRKMTYTIPVIPRRCDHFELRISGVGDVRIHSIARLTEQGSEL